MTLIARKDLKEGDEHPKNTLISYGTRLTKYRIDDCQTLAEWEKIEGTYKKDGWYVKIEIPFTRNLLHINPNTFDHEEGPCRYVILFRYRVANVHRKSIKHFIRGWFPI